MKICRVSQLKGGEVLARAVLTDGYQVLLGEGTRLLPEYIKKIQQLGIDEVFIENQDSEKMEILREETETHFKEKVRDILEHHTYSHNQELAQLAETADSLITSILEEEEVIEQVYDIRERSSDLYEHSISICTLSVLTALKLKMSREMVHDIGVACLLHDLGLRYLTIQYDNQPIEALSEEARNEFMKHPVYAYSALKNEKWISDDVKNMILYHHEQMDGSGYPLHARMLTLESRILNVCDAFDEMICGIGCKRRKVYEAIEELKKYRGIRYDGRILDAFLEFTAVYPAGTFVLTNEGETALIIRQNKQKPDRPVLRIVMDKEGNPITKEVIKDLLVFTDVFIEKAVEK
jgi:HD-GYP domain-containing protein (c-di-GMP phosphodiesterase class II)